MSKAKRNSLLFLSAAGILTLLLAMSLPTLSLSPGESFSLRKTDVAMPGVADSVPGSEALVWMLRGLMALALVFLPVYILYSLFSAKGRWRLVMNLVVVVILFWVADYLDKHPLSEDSEAPEMATGNSAEGLANDTSVAVFSEDSVPSDSAPSWLAVVVILAASTFGVGLLVSGVWFFRQRAARARLSLHPLAEVAQDTIESLQVGGDFRTAIIQCYHEMNRVVKEERGIARETAMTPREFEDYLVSRGLPHDALETLTRLFERVRYGSVPSRTDDETKAFACLIEIVNTCKAAKIGHDEQ